MKLNDTLHQSVAFRFHCAGARASSQLVKCCVSFAYLPKQQKVKRLVVTSSSLSSLSREECQPVWGGRVRYAIVQYVDDNGQTAARAPRDRFAPSDWFAAPEKEESRPARL